jgi:hypothetical protein
VVPHPGEVGKLPFRHEAVRDFGIHPVETEDVDALARLGTDGSVGEGNDDRSG